MVTLPDLPKAVEDYATRYVMQFLSKLQPLTIVCSVAPAIASSYSRPGVVVNFVTATGGDVEMLRSIECHYKIKCVREICSPIPKLTLIPEL